jgi:hypothetical protein
MPVRPSARRECEISRGDAPGLVGIGVVDDDGLGLRVFERNVARLVVILRKAGRAGGSRISPFTFQRIASVLFQRMPPEDSWMGRERNNGKLCRVDADPFGFKPPSSSIRSTISRI